MYDLVIKNGTVVNSWGMIEADVAVSSETIVAVGLGLSGKREIDAGGKLVIPGAVDTHVHLSLDLGGGLISSDDFFTGTRAAAFGGTTTVVPFVHPESGETMESAFRRRQNEAEGDVVVDYGWHMNIGPDAFKELGGLQAAVNRVKSLGIVTFKLYMAYGYRLSDSQLFQAMEAVGRAGGLSVVHAENWDLISFLVERAVHAGEHHPRWHETCRPSSFEAEAVSKVAAIAAYLSFPAEIFHVGNRAVSKTIEDARKKNIPLFGETCPQYLFLTTDAFDREGVKGAYPVCSPPIRPEADRTAMWDALSSGALQIVSTDHCPFLAEEKEKGLETGFQKIPGGVPSIEMRLSALYSEGVRSGHISPEQWIDVCCTTPARLHGFDRKGDIAPGKDADIVIFDPEKEHYLTAETLHERCGWTPYEGMKLVGKVESTLLRGRTVVDNGSFVGAAGMGKYISRSGIDARLH
jgi:dihydropyrimidinase